MIDFKLIGAQKFIAGMKVKGKELKTLRKPHAAIIARIDRWIQTNFKGQGSLTEGGGWKPLSAMYLAEKEKDKSFRSTNILIGRTLDLRTKWKEVITDDYAEYQSLAQDKGVYYGEIHDKGSGRIPKRKIIPTQKQAIPIIKEEYWKYLRWVFR